MRVSLNRNGVRRVLNDMAGALAFIALVFVVLSPLVALQAFQ